MEELGLRIKAMRKARNWTQIDLATAAGVTQQAVSDAERNNKAGRDVLISLARAFGVTVDALLQAADDSTDTSPSTELLQLYTILTPDAQATLLQVARLFARQAR